MTSGLRIALLSPGDGPQAHARAVDKALAAEGHQTTLLDGQASYIDALLAPRKIGDGLGEVPAGVVSLTRGRFDVAHAFTPLSALAAIAWARRSSGTAVFTCTEPLARETIAARRLRLATLRRALAGTYVLASNEPVAESLLRWMAFRAPVVPADDARRHSEIYRQSRSGLS
jgi:hypothetical protein